ncbi:hypothetical protein AAE478_004096 [Parahypoxylon ruwenzoriense]
MHGSVPRLCSLGVLFRDSPSLVKVASNQATLASSSAIKNLTALLPPTLQTYLEATIGHLSDAVIGSNEYLESQGVSPTLLYSTLAGTAAALVVPFSMSRWNWTPWASSSRDAISPYASQSDSQGVPHITDDDFSYITSDDLEQSLQTPSRTYDPQNRRPPPSSAADDDFDDVLLIKNKGVTYPVHFPAYSIGDGKLLVQDVRARVGLVMNLSDRRSRRLKMLYKGRQLKEQDIPIRDYGVKNNSELLVVVPDGRLSDDDDSGSSEEVVVAEDQQKSKKAKKNKNRKKKKDRPSPLESTPNLEVPGQRERDSSIHPSRVPSPAVPSGPREKLEAIRSHFDTKLLPLCRKFSAHPPKDMKKLEDEHGKLSETVMQQVLLKLDEVETGGDPDIRTKRRELVNYVQDILKEIDEHLPTGSKSRSR